jgi:predicted O-methyltransferase YrrM
VFDFITHVLNDNRHFYAYEAIEALRIKLLHNKTMLQVEDMGAGSVTGATKQRTIQQIAKWAAKPPKFAQLLFKMVNYYQCRHIVELGTSLGLSAAYMAAANKNAHVLTIEGDPAIAAMAQANFIQLNLPHIQLLNGNFDEVLPRYLSTIQQPIDLAFVDGNHRAAPTLNYLNQLLPHLNEHSIVVFDDIHWSAEMEETWHHIQQNTAVTMSIDLFFVGLVFFKKDFKVKQHFTIRF